MKNIYHTFLIGFAITLLLGSSFLYFYNGLSSEAAVSDSPLSSSNSSSSAVSTNTLNSKINSDTAFLAKLISLTKIKIDTKLFSDPIFQSLHDNNVPLEEVNTGRANPFAPIDENLPVTSIILSPVVTNQPAQITDKTAELRGAINSIATVSGSYFEYGPTPSLGKSTTSTAQSLVGTFATKVTGLSSGTTYFYRAVAKINNVLQYGEIVSFNTN